LIVLGNRAINHFREVRKRGDKLIISPAGGDSRPSLPEQKNKGRSVMKKILFVGFLLFALMVCLTSPAWAGGLDDAKAGLAAAKGGDYDEAIRLYTKAIESGELSREDLSITYYDRGIAWVKKGDYDKAIADWTKAIEIDPKYAEAYYNRGVAWAGKGDHAKAKADYEKAIEIDPTLADDNE
jgi:tetratricopeptide (TPR) repeat protein